MGAILCFWTGAAALRRRAIISPSLATRLSLSATEARRRQVWEINFRRYQHLALSQVFAVRGAA